MAPPEPQGLRPSHQPLDAGRLGEGLCGQGADLVPGFRRDDPGCPQALRVVLEAGQTLGGKRGPAVCPQKGARDRVIACAARRPEWVLGYQDECWWSRVTDPQLHTWS